MHLPNHTRSPGLASALFVLCLWQSVAWLQLVPPYLLPGPTAIATSLWGDRALLVNHVAATLLIALTGFFMALAFATTSAWLMQLFPQVRRIAYPWLVVSQAVPVIFVFPLLLLWFGFSDLPRVLIVALLSFFPIAVNLADSMQRCNPDLLLALRSMGTRRWQLVRRVRFMAALPDYFSGMRIAATYCVMGAVIAEWLGASRGLGVYMLRAYQSFTPARVFAAIVLIVLLTLLLVFAVRQAERIFTPWQRRSI